MDGTITATTCDLGYRAMASYQYEQLNGESFQHLSQCLLLRSFPDLQCFPVGQPDGGRDGIVRLFGATSETPGFILFQVKFTRRELNPSEAREWLLRTLANELPKIRNQIKSGAERFVLVTNVPGTGHQQAGSIDKLQDLLEQYVPIPAMAWWREDLDRRLDNTWDLKLAYPALLSGVDLLRLMIERTPSEGHKRRHYAIRTFLSHGYNSDRELKFKQAELENNIFNLFTDVPLVPPNLADMGFETAQRLTAVFRRVARSVSNEVDTGPVRRWSNLAMWRESSIRTSYHYDEAWIGAASALLDSDFQQAEPLVILEGAPGQGKSTIAQYICQVHRMRLLDRVETRGVDAIHRNSSLRLPFKAELRDFATWLSGGDPFGSGTDGGHPVASPRTLEGFLAALVRYGSGGSNFDVSDLHVTLSASPILIVLDGLDEVAEVTQRRRVAEEINSAIPRLKEVAESLQVVVTSRPSPFINSTLLSRRTFVTYSLVSLTRPLITEYSERWLRAKAIDEADARDVRLILQQKLDEPHLRDLARNPMQLAILLSLIHRRGLSLPDKRTSLYDNYVDMFFDRESEKATVVRENRDLLIRLHRYLAWVLQSEVEVGSRSTSRIPLSRTSLSGTIAESDLKALLIEYLESEGSDPRLVDRLFTGMVERVVAIVSRVEGFYEFDVQTLREYFAARHLYQTAPYSPPGNERRGTISDRWRALSRSYYWLNVARFYAGCYSEGELASLVDDLYDLREDEVFRFTNHPQLLTATLLGDWVFSQRPRAIQDAVDLLLEPSRLRLFLAGTRSLPHHRNEVIVREHQARDRLVTTCKRLVRPGQPFDYVMDIVQGVLGPNTQPDELVTWWMDGFDLAEGSEAARWCLVGERLLCWSVISHDAVAELLDRERIPSSNVMTGLLHASRMDVLESNEELFDTAVDAVLSGVRVGRSRSDSLLRQLAGSLELAVLPIPDSAFHSGTGLALHDYLISIRGEDHDEENVTRPSYATADRCARLVEAFARAAERPVSEWLTSIEPWDWVVQQGMSEFGQRQRFTELANLAAGIRSKDQQCLDSSDLFEVDRPLVRRARYARLRAGSRKWWSKQLQSANNANDQWMALLLFSTWAGARTIENLVEEFDSRISSLGTSDWRNLYYALRRAGRTMSGRSWIRPLRINVRALPSSVSARTAAILVERCTRSSANDLYGHYLADYEGDDIIVMSLRADVQAQHALKDEAKWPQAIEGLRSIHNLGAPTRSIRFQRPRRPLPALLAREVVGQPLEFPVALVRAAEAACRQLDAARVLPVGRVATDEGWFVD